MANNFYKKNDSVDTSKLTASVGKGGENHKPDVERVQAMLLLQGYQPGNVDCF